MAPSANQADAARNSRRPERLTVSEKGRSVTSTLSGPCSRVASSAPAEIVIDTLGRFAEARGSHAHVHEILTGRALVLHESPGLQVNPSPHERKDTD